MRTLGLLACALTLALPAAGDDLIAKAQAVSTEGPLYNYEMTFRSSEVEEASGAVYPTAPEGERLKIAFPPEDEWSDDFRKGVEELDKQTNGEVWCAEFAQRIPLNAERVSEDDRAISYTFTPVPEEDADGAQKKLFRNMIGTASIDPETANVRHFQMHLPEPVKPNFMAKINTFSMYVECAEAPDGRAYLKSMEMDMAGSALGQSFSEQVSRQITKLLEPVARPLD